MGHGFQTQILYHELARLSILFGEISFVLSFDPQSGGIRKFSANYVNYFSSFLAKPLAKNTVCCYNK